MDRQHIEDDEREIAAGVPPHLLRVIEAGLDDLRHGRTDPGDVLLAALDAKIDAWKARKAMMDHDGESRSDSQTSC